MPDGLVKADPSMDTLSEKVGALEERAMRLAREETEQVQRGRALNIITGTPNSTPSATPHSTGNKTKQRDES
jgi:hypothetical protein